MSRQSQPPVPPASVPVGQPIAVGAPMSSSGPPVLEPATTGFPPPAADPGAPLEPPPRASADAAESVRLRRVAGVALWASVLGFGGLVVGVAAFVKILSHPAAWFEPVVVAVGVIGIALTAAAFPVVRRGMLSWLLLGAATLVLVIAAILTAVA